MNQSFVLFHVLFLFLFLLHCTLLTLAQGPAAAPVAAAEAPAPSGPTSVIAILKKDGRFTLFIRLLQSTKVADSLDSQLSSDDQNSGLTIFAPTDNSFSSLKTGMLNSLTDDQKSKLVQFHILPFCLLPSQFQTASNPLRTQAGDSTQLLGMNVTAIGNQVNITTGETNATVANTIYSDNRLAVYEVDKVLLPMRFYKPLPPPPPSPPPPTKPDSKAPVYDAHVDSSSPTCLSKKVLIATACILLVVAT